MAKKTVDSSKLAKTSSFCSTRNRKEKSITIGSEEFVKGRRFWKGRVSLSQRRSLIWCSLWGWSIIFRWVLSNWNWMVKLFLGLNRIYRRRKKNGRNWWLEWKIRGGVGLDWNRKLKRLLLSFPTLASDFVWRIAYVNGTRV